MLLSAAGVIRLLMLLAFVMLPLWLISILHSLPMAQVIRLPAMTDDRISTLAET